MTNELLSLGVGSCGFFLGFTLFETVYQTGYDEIQLVCGGVS